VKPTRGWRKGGGRKRPPTGYRPRTGQIQPRPKRVASCIVGQFKLGAQFQNPEGDYGRGAKPIAWKLRNGGKAARGNWT